MKAEMNEVEIATTYNLIKKYHENYLKQYGVKLPSLKNKKGNYIKDALVLVYLARFYPNTVVVTKKELTKFVRKFYPDVNDVQQARHLGAQKGWFISAGGRDNVHVKKSGEYQLITLEKPYPNFTHHRVKIIDKDNWSDILSRYNYRCATCGSKEGEKHLHWTNTITRLQKSHKDPRKPLIKNNIIPQCQKCNRAYRNFWIFDDKGRVRGIANPKIILKCDESIKKEIFQILKKEYEK
jgi:predicted restriction endonuclease